MKPVEAHKQDKKLKSAIKTHQIDYNKLTGLANFTQLSKDPLALPAYAKPDAPTRQNNDDAEKDKSHADIKAKRPDDKKKVQHDKKPHVLDSKNTQSSAVSKQHSAQMDDKTKSEQLESNKSSNRAK